ncbi:hypothetical protein V5799_000933 [Amblyomma americanum]|uniref:M13 family peptidase n=1 Tax=Amblyomma americanum TaxID=6943 RepID=A0AAQ4D1N9_AMBAM
MATSDERKAAPSSSSYQRQSQVEVTNTYRRSQGKKTRHQKKHSQQKEEASQDTSTKVEREGGARAVRGLERAGTSQKSPRVGLILLLFFALLFVALIVLALLIKKQRPRDPVTVCSSQDCRRHAQELRAALNLSVDPCDDFHAFVCGSWERSSANGSAAGVYRDRLMVESAERAIGELQSDLILLEGASSKDSSRTAHLASLFYRSCSRPNAASDLHATTAKAKLERFRELRAKMRLSWPEDLRSPTLEPVDVMLDLAINWNENFLFDAQLVNVSGRPVTLFLTRGKPLAGWVHYVEPSYYATYVTTYFQYLGLNTSARDNHPPPNTLRSLTRDFLAVKMDTATGEPNQTWFRLDLFDNPTPWIQPGLWLSLLNKHFSPDLSWSSEHWVVVQDSRLIEGVQSLLKKYNKRQFVIGLSWIFVQTHLWAILDLPRIRFGTGATDEFVSLIKKYSCLEYVQSRLGALVLPDLSALSSKRPDAKILERLVNATHDLIEKLPWIGNERHAALHKTRYLTSSPFPHQTSFDVEGRETLYATFPPMGTDFATDFVESSLWFQSKRKERNLLALYGRRTSSGHAQVSYIYALNSVLISMAAFEAPLYYANSTYSVISSGVGSILAREVARAFDPTGSEINEEGRTVIWWGPSRSRQYLDRVTCDLNASECCTSTKLFPLVPGLEIAFHAYKIQVRLDNDSPSDYRLQGLENLTDDQIFFITYCYVLCGSYTAEGVSCNMPLKNFQPFSQAFGCAVGARMNPHHKCAFFS